VSVRITQEVGIARMRAWCQANYSRGADTMVECWEQSDWERHWNDASNYTDAFKILRRVAAVYRDQQADARYYQENA